jgi:hypothetical protein
MPQTLKIAAIALRASPAAVDLFIGRPAEYTARPPKRRNGFGTLAILWERSRAMDIFRRMASMAAANLLGASAGRRITNEQLALQLEQMALTDPELAEHYARLAAAVPALEAQRAVEDAALAPPPRQNRNAA